MIDFPRMLTALGIPFTTEGKNIGNGWIGIRCPVCPDHSDHGGFNLIKGHYSCWKCGWHRASKIIAILAKTTEENAKKIIRQYTTPYLPLTPHHNEPCRALYAPTGPLKLPGQPLTLRHQQYLISRKFNPAKLAALYGLLGTGPVGRLKHRIIIPIIQDGTVVSYQGRDITDMAGKRYLPCLKEEEIKPWKHCLYNIDNCNDKIIIVEGVTDVWRLGYGAVSTFGTKFTTEQVKLIFKKNIKEVFILFDNEPTAQKQAYKLAREISGQNIEVTIVTELDNKDPAELSWQDAKELKRSLLK
jgi:5S rRNA maturation endonuclease (ribonuclease M5)